MRAVSVLFATLLLIASPASAAPAAEATIKGTGTVQASQVDPRSVELNEKAVIALQTKDLKHAEELLKEALHADSGNLTAAYNLATVYLALKEFKEAITLLKEYGSKTAGDATFPARLGDVYFAMKNVKEAITAYESALAIDPKSPGTCAKLGTLYTMSNRLADAEKILFLAVEQEPGNADTLSNLSALLLANGKPEQAVQTAKRALQVNPTSRVYVIMGNAYQAQGDLNSAVIALQRALDMGDKTPDLKKNIELLQRAKQEK